MTKDRYDAIGVKAQEEICHFPEMFKNNDWPYKNLINANMIMKSLGMLKGKKILEFGCGLGNLSVYLAKRGAFVCGIDLSRECVKAAKSIAGINKAECSYCCGNIMSTPYKSKSFDLVIGMCVLHHLSIDDVIRCLRNVHDLLVDSGKAVFFEPVENSKLFEFLQNIIPAGRKKSGYYRPSCVRKKEWDVYNACCDDRSMTEKEIITAGYNFKNYSITHVGLFGRLDRVIYNEKCRQFINRIDARVLRVVPLTRYFARNILVEYYK